MRTIRNHSVQVSGLYNSRIVEALCDFFFYPSSQCHTEDACDFDYIDLISVRISGVECLENLPEDSFQQIMSKLYEEFMYE